MKTLKRYSMRITDSNQSLSIRVKPEDIDGAICRDHQKCVIARAIMRQRKGTATWVDVGNSVVTIGTGKKTGKRYMLDSQSKMQVRFFDENDGRFAPCVLNLKVPARKLGERVGDGSSGKERRKRSKNRVTPTR